METFDQDARRAGRERDLELERVLNVLRRRAKLILACLVGAALIAAGISLLQPKEYSASASLLFRNPGFAEDVFGSTTAPTFVDAGREAATNQKLVGLRVVGELAAKKIPGLTGSEVTSMVSVAAEGEANVVSVTATSTDPAQARRVANTFARQFIRFRADADKSKLVEAKEKAEKQYEALSAAQREAPRGEALSRGAEKLGILASLQTGNAELVQPANLPTSPSSPKPLRNAIFGAFLGLLLGIAMAFLFERLNRRLRDPEDAQAAFGLPIVGTVPESKAILASNQGATAADLPFAENEAFRMLRASLRYFNVDADMRSVLITSHSANVGKTTVAWNLARVGANSAKTIVVETDLRNPTLANQHGLRHGPGLAEVLTHQVQLDEAIQHKPLGTQGDLAPDQLPQLAVLTSGSLPPNPAELIESKAMRDVLSQLSEQFDFVVVDTAPLGVVPDAFALIREVNGVIIVARMEQTTRDAAEELRDRLDHLEAPVLGVVANAVNTNKGRKYGYGYAGQYYGPGSQERQSPAERDGAGPDGRPDSHSVGSSTE